MQLIWYGHSCFLIKTSTGKRILMDPFENSIGYNSNFPKCDLITISHNHFDHSYLNKANEKTKVINELGFFDMNFSTIEGLSSFHDKSNGAKRGLNIIYVLKINNVTICHLGDLGHIPAPLILERLKNIDILLVPIGGHFTLNGSEAAKTCNLISPKYIIPMHYKNNITTLYLDDPKNFIISMKNIKKINSNIIDYNNLHYNAKCQVLLLTPPYT